MRMSHANAYRPLNDSVVRRERGGKLERRAFAVCIEAHESRKETGKSPS